MRHMVHYIVTPEAGLKIEARPGGPGPVVGRLVERFKPEAMYLCPVRRECWMVVDLPTPADMAEMMIAIVGFAGAYPEIMPVMTGQEFGPVVAKAMPAARKILDG